MAKDAVFGSGLAPVLTGRSCIAPLTELFVHHREKPKL